MVNDCLSKHTDSFQCYGEGKVSLVDGYDIKYAIPGTWEDELVSHFMFE